jgi:hypothetical protein
MSGEYDFMACANDHPHRMHNWQLSLRAGNGPWLSCPGRLPPPTRTSLEAWTEMTALREEQQRERGER